MNNFMLSFVLPVVITTTWFPPFDSRAEIVPLRDWAPVISTQLMTVSFVEEEVKPDTSVAKTEEQTKEETRPEWLPEKFKTPEDLAKSYGELEKKMTTHVPKEYDFSVINRKV